MHIRGQLSNACRSPCSPCKLPYKINDTDALSVAFVRRYDYVEIGIVNLQTCGLGGEHAVRTRTNFLILFRIVVCGERIVT